MSAAHSFDDAPRGYDALLERVALGPAPAADFLDLIGPDARRFLNGYVTNDARALAARQHSRGFLTRRDGKLLADLDLVALDDRLRLRLPPGAGEPMRAHLAKYLLADRVELVPRAGLERLRLAGPAAAAPLRALGLEPPVPGAFTIAERAGAELLLLGVERGRSPRFELWTEAGALDRLETELLDAGAERASAAAFETLRVEAGELAFGIDYGPESFPQESGDDAAVSYSKGCYLGQEVVARLRWRGQAQRLPCGLRFPDRLPAPGTVVLHDGRPAGRATSVARSPRFDAIGLALLHRRVGEPPARLELEGGGVAELVALPFE
jgi:folate-binding protein YgfZ